jgi:hypothetical protein
MNRVDARGHQHFAPATLKLAGLALRVGKNGTLCVDVFEKLRLVALNRFSDLSSCLLPLGCLRPRPPNRHLLLALDVPPR